MVIKRGITIAVVAASSTGSMLHAAWSLQH
jgi:hypothetical protein